jgi:E3 ubiquitin-protein ligase MARCH6
MTDPIVDGLLFLLNLLLRPLKWGITRVFPLTLPVPEPSVVAPPTPPTGLNLTAIQNAVYRYWGRLIAHSQAAADPSVPQPSPTNTVEHIIFRLPAPSMQSLEHVESRLAAFGRTVRLFSHAFARRWQQLAIADGTSERAFAICLGYIVLCMIMGIYLGVLNAGTVRGAARALRNAVKQQLIVVKVREVLSGRYIFVQRGDRSALERWSTARPQFGVWGCGVSAFEGDFGARV